MSSTNNMEWPAEGCSCLINQPEGNIIIKEDCPIHVLNPQLRQRLSEAERNAYKLEEAIKHHLYVCPLPCRNLRANVGWKFDIDLARPEGLPPESLADIEGFDRQEQLLEDRIYYQAWGEALDIVENALDDARERGRKGYEAAKRHVIKTTDEARLKQERCTHEWTLHSSLDDPLAPVACSKCGLSLGTIASAEIWKSKGDV